MPPQSCPLCGVSSHPLRAPAKPSGATSLPHAAGDERTPGDAASSHQLSWATWPGKEREGGVQGKAGWLWENEVGLRVLFVLLCCENSLLFHLLLRLAPGWGEAQQVGQRDPPPPPGPTEPSSCPAAKELRRLPTAPAAFQAARRKSVESSRGSREVSLEYEEEEAICPVATTFQARFAFRCPWEKTRRVSSPSFTEPVRKPCPEKSVTKRRGKASSEQCPKTPPLPCLFKLPSVFTGTSFSGHFPMPFPLFSCWDTPRLLLPGMKKLGLMGVSSRGQAQDWVFPGDITIDSPCSPRRWVPHLTRQKRKRSFLR